MLYIIDYIRSSNQLSLPQQGHTGKSVSPHSTNDTELDDYMVIETKNSLNV